MNPVLEGTVKHWNTHSFRGDYSTYEEVLHSIASEMHINTNCACGFWEGPALNRTNAPLQSKQKRTEGTSCYSLVNYLKWANFMDDFKAWAPFRTHYHLHEQLSAQSHITRQDRVPANIPMRTERERESDEETCLDCRGYDVVVCFEAVHLHVNTQNLIRWVTKHISWTKWIERNHIVLVKLFFTMNLTNKHCRGSQTVYIMTQVFNLWLKHP